MLEPALTNDALLCRSIHLPTAAVADFNFGTLIRTDASDEYTQFNTTFGMSSTLIRIRVSSAA